MTEYKLTDVAKEELDFECSECGSTDPPKLDEVDETRNPLVDFVVKTACSNCGNVPEVWANVWDRDIEVISDE